MNTVARIQGLSHRYGETQALTDVNLAIPGARIVGLVGPDGAGKSSVLALLAGAREIQAGSVEVLGGEMGKPLHRKAVAPRVAYMPQGLGKNLYPTLSVFENVNFFGQLFGHAWPDRRRRIAELLAGTGLAPFAERPAGKLSGGMKQKLGLCCALIHDPDLLVLDEPTTGVDPLSRRNFWQLIVDIRQRHPVMSIVVATAYMEEAEGFDWLVAMDAGRILATGRPADIKMQTASDTLDDAYIQLLPASKRLQHAGLRVRAYQRRDSQPAIEARGLSKRFNQFTAVDTVSFAIYPGEIFGFLGSNGCGKTTTMKMLTGLLPASEGEARLFGRPVDTRDLATRKRVGYMSQSFSLYGELSVLQNLRLHAQLFHLPATQIARRVEELIAQFELDRYRDALPAALPLGIRQRLSLAVAIVHQPELLILDEPTSGVDPIARDQFWAYLIELSREQRVTIFISTHFMHEAERCDRVSLMHAGRVLASDSPAALVKNSRGADLEEAFIYHLTQAGEAPADKHAMAVIAAQRDAPRTVHDRRAAAFSLQRLLAYSQREATELLRDPIRLAFALVGPIILMLVFGYGISFDVENIAYAVLDQDQTPASRRYLENYQASDYFQRQSPLGNLLELDRRLQSGELAFAIVVPPNFGKDLQRGRRPTIGVLLDGAVTFRAETIRGYVRGIHAHYLARYAAARQPVLDIETRFRYNQEFKSVYAMVPGIIMLLLMMIPAMMTAAGVVREKELGSITNLYVTPVTRWEFLLGKQLPYVAVAYFSFLTLLLVALTVFQVPVKGSVVALFFGSFLYVVASTGFGLLVSTFVKSQIAAIFAAAILCVVPTINFSGFMSPVSSIEGGGKYMGYGFPSGYYQQIAVGSMTKALDFAAFLPNYAIIALFITVFLCLSVMLLKEQEL